MDVTESPVADWSKEQEYNNWFIKFGISPDDDDSFEVNVSAENSHEVPPPGGDNDDD
jgi:hypothetical protein